MIIYDDEDIGTIHDYLAIIKTWAGPKIDDYIENYNNERIRNKCDQIAKVLDSGKVEAVEV